MDLWQIAQAFGFPALCVVGLSVGVFKILLIPLRDAHIRMIETLAEQTIKNTQCLEQVRLGLATVCKHEERRT